MSNDVEKYPEDSFDNMIKFQKKYNFDFPYLYDLTQDVAKKYKAVCTSDFFGFNHNIELQYRGRIDSGTIKKNKIIKWELYYAMKLISIKGIGPKKLEQSFEVINSWTFH